MHRILIGSCISLLCLLPVVAGAQGESARPEPAPRATTGVSGQAVCPEPAPASGANADWRLEAYRHLDCVIGIAERALEGATGDTVTLTREDVERIRTFAWWSKDAAARIGR